MAKLGNQDDEFLATDRTTQQKRNDTPWSAGVWGAGIFVGVPFSLDK